MYFILSKILVFLTMPFYWVLLLATAGFIVKDKKRKKRFFIAALIVFYIFSNSFLFTQIAKRWDVPFKPLTNGKPYSCAIVLGGFSTSNGHGSGFFNFAADRFIQGVKLITTKKATHLLISGGNGNLAPGQFREAIWVKTQLNDLNIPDSVILTESNSKNTFENAKFSKALLDKTHLPPPYLLVTSAFHMRRSLMTFKKAGLHVIPYSCNFFTADEPVRLTDFAPSIDTLNSWDAYIKEIIGYAVNYFK